MGNFEKDSHKLKFFDTVGGKNIQEIAKIKLLIEETL